MNSLPIHIHVPRVIALNSRTGLRVVKNDRKAQNKPEILDAPQQTSSGEFMVIPMKGKMEVIGFSEIVYVEAESNYIRFFLKDRRPVLASRTLKSVSSNLEKAGFIRVHKSFMLHPSCIQHYDLSNSCLVLRSGEKIPVSRANRKFVSDKILSFSF